MSYAVFVGDIQIPFNPENVSSTLERKIKSYSVIGQGNVSKLEDTSLQKWSFEFLLTASNDLHSENFMTPVEVLSYLEDKLKRGNQQRLVISNGSELNVSLLVYLEQLEKKEIQDGCYEIGLKLVEYIEAKAKETGIPFIQRPGIIPPNKPIKSNGSSYNAKKKAEDEFDFTHGGSVVCGTPSNKKQNQVNEIVNGGYISYEKPNYDYDDSLIRDYVEKSDQPIQYTYPTQKSQADINSGAINYGLDVFIG